MTFPELPKSKHSTNQGSTFYGNIWKYISSLIPLEELERVKEFMCFLSGKKHPSNILMNQEVNPRLYFPGLTSKPWYDTGLVPGTKVIESSFNLIQNEFNQLFQNTDLLKPYDNNSELFREYIKHSSSLSNTPNYNKSAFDEQAPLSFYFHQLSGFVNESYKTCPCTAKTLSKLSIAREAYFSILKPRTRIFPHSDKANFIVTCHLGISIPPKCGIEVAGTKQIWHEGECIVFDSSFIHEVWNNSDQLRGILLVDLWHPDLTKYEVEAISFILKSLHQHSICSSSKHI